MWVRFPLSLLLCYTILMKILGYETYKEKRVNSETGALEYVAGVRRIKK